MPPVIRRTAGMAIVAAAALAFLFGCATPSGNGDNNRQPPAGTGTAGNGVPSGTQVGGPAPTTAPPVSYPNTANAYASAATTAWSTGDTTRLGQLTDPAATIWTTLNGGDYNKAFGLYQCTGAAGSSICALYNAVGDELDLQIRNDRIGSAQAVIGGQWHPITFPTDYKAYAQEAIDDWGKHNDAAVKLLVSTSNSTAFNVVPSSHRGDQWTFDHQEGAAGHMDFLFRNAAGDTIVIDFLNPGIQPPPANRHHLIETVYWEPHP
jgi:hypothetical protein